jgi:molybdate/tungstate transport system substrate-binding protein
MNMQDRSSESTSVRVLHAGSLTALVRQGLGPAFSRTSGIALESVSGHSVALAMAIKAQRMSADIFLSADAEVNQTLFGPTHGDWLHWFVVFARNAIVLAYSPRSRFLADFERARQGAIPWYQVLLQPGVKLSRNNPNDDPLGYYTVMVCALAQEHYHLPDLKQSLLGSDTNPAQIHLPHLSHLERGEIDAMFLYRSGAAEHSLPYVHLPDEINLSNPMMESTYAQVHFTTDTGQTFHGKPISFSAAVLSKATHPQAALQLVTFLFSPAGQQLIRAAHFLPSPALVGGDAAAVPDELRPLLKGVYPSSS